MSFFPLKHGNKKFGMQKNYDYRSTEKFLLNIILSQKNTYFEQANFVFVGEKFNISSLV